MLELALDGICMMIQLLARSSMVEYVRSLYIHE